MATLGELIKIGYNSYKSVGIYNDINYFNSNSSIKEKFYGLEVKSAYSKTPPARATAGNYATNSNYLKPIEISHNRLAGYGRGWGQASSDVQHNVMDLILQNSKHLSPENQAILLATARLESGFNPDAAATSTSASGVFQIVSKTANSLGLAEDKIFDAKENILAGIKLFEENLIQVKRRYPQLSGEEKAVMLYAFHHDGPSLAYGGAMIARKNILPYLDEFRALTYKQAFGERY